MHPGYAWLSIITNPKLSGEEQLQRLHEYRKESVDFARAEIEAAARKDEREAIIAQLRTIASDMRGKPGVVPPYVCGELCDLIDKLRMKETPHG